jgi:hypothetical protein
VSAGATLSGPLVIGNPLDGCDRLQTRAGGIFVLDGNAPCSPLNQAYDAAQAGAIAVLLADANGFSPPSSVELPDDQLQQITIPIPVVAITNADAQILLDNSGRTITLSLSSDNTRMTGADAQGRPFLYASDPVRPGSTVSHWDPLARPDLIQEPESGYGHPHDVTIEAALMRDIGWATFCGNGQLDSGEACDDGAGNSDSTADACRTTCARAACGDGVKDSGEACDQGARNGSSGAGCTATCTVATTTTTTTTTTTPPPATPKTGCACAVEAATPGDHSLLALALGIAGAVAMVGGRARRRRR